jgi:hypothetical protein
MLPGIELQFQLIQEENLYLLPGAHYPWISFLDPTFRIIATGIEFH